MSRSKQVEALKQAQHGLSVTMSALPVNWQPIDTAPKDGTSILAMCRHGMYVVRWVSDGSDMMTGQPGWTSGVYNACDEYIDLYPTHWMPLPDRPEGA